PTTQRIVSATATDPAGNTSESSADVAAPVTQATTTTVLNASPATSVFGQSITFTATVGAVPPGATTPTGAVTFKEGSATLGTGTLNTDGLAAFVTSTLAVGSHTITAGYSGDDNFTGSSGTANE